MSDINNLTSKILSDAEAKKEEILAKASEEKEKILQKKQNSAKALEKEILEKAKSEAATRKERTISSAELTARNEKLKAKQEVIADVFLESVDKLSSLDKDVQVKFIKDTILNLDIDGDEKLILNDAGKEMVTDSVLGDINKSLKSKGKKGEISLSTENGSFKGGFILEKAGIEINNTYEALVSSLREELEFEVAKVLFS
ncbi:V-type ATP synthase subunit E [Clostridium sp. HCP1S3_B4]|uniref:V-type ATP synthase subunit E n=1 Tax=unclassified Clostridium TaxID=2614128 RepID=UPI0016AD8C27|nr:V-type ATP synthase subunit E family protein [Clostridiales bacterium]MDY2730513.1 V-type ATP synthase subunit E family protein [Clostridium sp.]NLK24523.1 V-type ATP synthase subunit E [Clostridiales bacterium]